MQTTVSYITSLANIPSPTGFTAKIMQYVVSELRSFGYEPILTAKCG